MERNYGESELLGPIYLHPPSPSLFLTRYAEYVNKACMIFAWSDQGAF